MDREMKANRPDIVIKDKKDRGSRFANMPNLVSVMLKLSRWLHWGYASVSSSCTLPTPYPPPPPGNCRAFAHLVSPRGGALANLVRPGGQAFANPGGTPEKFVNVFNGLFS